MSTRVSILRLAVGLMLLTACPGRVFAHLTAGSAVENGDMNGDLQRDISGAVYLFSQPFYASVFREQSGGRWS